MWYLIVNGKKFSEMMAFAEYENVERVAYKLMDEYLGVKKLVALKAAYEGSPASSQSPARYFYRPASKGVVIQVVARPVESACVGVNLL